MAQVYDVAILGAGLAGLASGFQLVEMGKKPVIIEKGKVVGGLCRSFETRGFIFDLGGHRFLPKDKKIRDFVSSLFSGNELRIGERNSQVYLRGKFLLYPPVLLDTLGKLGFTTSIDCLVKGLYAWTRQQILKKEEISLQDWVVNRFGQSLYNIYFGPYSAKLWGRDPAKISSDWAAQRIRVPSINMAILNLVISNQSEMRARKFLYPQGGIGEIPSRIADKVKEGGGRIFPDHQVVKVTNQLTGFRIETRGPGGERRRFCSKKLISTIPLPELLSILAPSPPPDVIESAKRLCFRSVRFLNLMVDAPQLTKNTWLYTPERNCVFFRIQEFSNWEAGNSPPGKTSLTLEVACDNNDALWKMKDEELLNICLENLKEMGIDLENKVIGYFSSYAEHAYPVYFLEYKYHLQKIYRFIGNSKNLIICGRQGLFRYINMDKVLETGFEAAASLYKEAKRQKLLRCGKETRYLEQGLCLTNE